MLTLMHDVRHWRLTEVVEHELARVLDETLDVVLAPWSVDFTGMEWGSQRDETWM